MWFADIMFVRSESLKKPDRHSELRSRVYSQGMRGKVEPTKGGWGANPVRLGLAGLFLGQGF